MKQTTLSIKIRNDNPDQLPLIVSFFLVKYYQFIKSEEFYGTLLGDKAPNRVAISYQHDKAACLSAILDNNSLSISRDR